jgi:hypothetical protein
MRLYFGGAEIPEWAQLLADVPDISLSFVGLARRKNSDWDLVEHFPVEQNIFLDSGAYTYNKEGSGFDRTETQSMALQYQAFITANISRVEMVSEFDAQILGQEYINSQREIFYDNLGDKFMPIWHANTGMEELERLASTYKHVGILQTDVDGRDIGPVLNNLVGTYGVLLHGVALTHMGLMRSIRWDSVGSTSWISPTQFGDTFVWTGKELKRYPMKYKETARKRHRVLFEREGFDPQLIADDDRTEVLKLSIWSWTQFINDINRHGVTTLPDNVIPLNAESAGAEVDTLPPHARNDQLITKRPLQTIPVMDVYYQTIHERDEDGRDSTTEVPIIAPRSSSLRMCDTCFLKNKCPGYEPAANCLYDIPIEVKTPQQLRALYDGLVAFQTQRVMFMQMAEQIEGGYADPNLSSEIDRLQRLIKQKQDAEREGFTMTMQVTDTSKPGAMARFFGSDVAQKLNSTLPSVSADAIIHDAEIIDE